VMFTVWIGSLGEDSLFADTRVQSAIKGVVALIALQMLRGERRPWFWYPLAGALPGLLLLGAELLTRLGAGPLAGLVAGDQAGAGAGSLLEPSAQQLRDALIVLGVGATVCLLASLRTLMRAKETPEESTEDY
jgi:hypothetical protein